MITIKDDTIFFSDDELDDLNYEIFETNIVIEGEKYKIVRATCKPAGLQVRRLNN